MKKLMALALLVVCVLAVAGCGKDTYTIGITVPAGSQERFVFADQEICPTGKKIKISCGEGLWETSVLLAPVDETITAGYVETYMDHGLPATFDTDPGIWLRVGVCVQNDTDKDKTVYIAVTGVEVRIE
jgi:hypothetical protein